MVAIGGTINYCSATAQIKNNNSETVKDYSVICDMCKRTAIENAGNNKITANVNLETKDTQMAGIDLRFRNNKIRDEILKRLP